MRRYVGSMVDYVASQMAVLGEGGGRLLLMIPQLPGDAAMLLEQGLASLCLDRQVRLDFKVAEELVRTWLPQHAQGLEQRLRAEGSLTGRRNAVDGNGRALQILVGSAQVADKASLADFHQCGPEVLWERQLRSSFKGWIEDALAAADIASEPASLERMDHVLGELRELFGLYQISLLLDEVRFSAGDAPGAERELLASLGRFGLPNLQSFKLGKNRQTFRRCLDGASEFLSYEPFMDAARRSKALKSLDAFEKAGGSVLPEKRGPFEDDASFLAALRGYVERKAPDPRLAACDFLCIRDEILKFSSPGDKKERKDGTTVRRLAGGPVEVVLHALWLALGQRESRQGIDRIWLKGTKFRHDCMAGEGGAATASDLADAAREALARLLGGMDDICRQRVQLAADEDGQELTPIDSQLLDEQLVFASAHAAEPQFEFQVGIRSGQDEDVFLFAWRLPETHPYRLASGLIQLAAQELERARGAWVLPAYHLAYHQELMAAKDEDEICRVLLHCISERLPGADAFMVNLYSEAWQQESDPFAPYLRDLCQAHRAFFEQAHAHGIHAALMGSQPVELLRQYRRAAEAFTKKDGKVKDSVKLAAMLMRAFLALPDKRGKEVAKWAVARHEPSAVVTVLHPALLEMLQAQIVFLLSAFSSAATTELRAGGPFGEDKWQRYRELADVQMPIVGLLVDESHRLDVNVSGKNLVHRVGRAMLEDAPMTTRLLIRHDSMDEEDASDAELFMATKESKMLSRLLADYWLLHPHASDGIALGVYRNEDVQPVLSAIHDYLGLLESKGVLDADRPQKHFLRLVLFSESADETAVVRWLEQWQERWEEEGGASRYARCQLSVSHRIVASAADRGQFAAMLEQDGDFDLLVLYNFVKAGRQGNEFRPADEFDETKDTLKFPILEKSLCASAQPDSAFLRAQIVSNRQFRIGALHAEIMARLKSSVAQGVEHVVLGHGDYEPWTQVVDAAHEAAEWVVCIDPTVDKALIAHLGGNGAQRRELIGFGSGVGSHGESNYTISTQKFVVEDLRRILLDSFRRIYAYGTPQDDAMIASVLMASAQSLAGLSLIRALGPSEHVRDFMSYALTQRLLPPSDGHVCDQLFSIDAYRHWFDAFGSDDRRHPDLLWLRAALTPERSLRIEARLLECKMAREGEDHVDKAQAQIKNGLRVLAAGFRPRRSAVSDERPEQRYWHLQLHRLIASCARISAAQEAGFLSAMERLAAEGEFEIQWHAAVLTFWTDSRQDGLVRSGWFEAEESGEAWSVPIYSAGYKFLKDVCSGSPPELAASGIRSLMRDLGVVEGGPGSEWIEEPRMADAATLPDRAPCPEDENGGEWEAGSWSEASGEQDPMAEQMPAASAFGVRSGWAGGQLGEQPVPWGETSQSVRTENVSDGMGRTDADSAKQRTGADDAGGKPTTTMPEPEAEQMLAASAFGVQSGWAGGQLGEQPVPWGETSQSVRTENVSDGMGRTDAGSAKQRTGADDAGGKPTTTMPEPMAGQMPAAPAFGVRSGWAGGHQLGEQPVPWGETPQSVRTENVSDGMGRADAGSAKQRTGADDAGGKAEMPEPGPATLANARPLPSRILLGRAGQRSVFWEFGHKSLSNRHLLIFGSSGMGKTYAIQAILCELGRQGQNSLIVDYTDGFLPGQLQGATKAALQPVQHVVKQRKLPISPFKKQKQRIEHIVIPDTSIDVAKRVAATFKTVHELGDQQFSVLTDAIHDGMEQFNEALTLDNVLDILMSYLEDKMHAKSTVQSTIGKLKPFVQGRPFAAEADGMGWPALFADADRKCHVFQLTMIDRSSQKILTEFILWDLYAHLRNSGETEASAKVVVLDEVQNLDHSLDAPVAKYLTEGRKFGLSLISATQTLSNLDRDQQARLFNAAHKLFFRPSEPEMSRYADYVRQAAGRGDRNEWMQMLSSLQKGECLSIGPALDERSGRLGNWVGKIKIASLEDRGLHG